MAGTEGSLQRLIKTPRTALVRASGQWYHQGLRCCCWQPSDHRMVHFSWSQEPQNSICSSSNTWNTTISKMWSIIIVLLLLTVDPKNRFFFRFFYLEQRSLHYRFADKSPFNWKDLIQKNKITICNVLEAIQFSQTSVEADLPPLKKRVSTHNLLCVLT